MRGNWSLLLVFLLLSSCSLFEDPGAELILNVDNEFSLDMREELLPESRALRLSLLAVNEVMCDESELIMESAKNGRFINIQINEISMVGNCDSGKSFPSGEADFDVRKILYDLEIKVKDLTSHFGTINVTGKEYSIALEDTKGLTLLTNNLKSVPSNFVWGYFQNSNEQVSTQVETFLRANDLEDRPLSHLTPGFYSYFSIDDVGMINISEIPFSGSVSKFGFDNVDLNNLKSKVTGFKSRNPDIKFMMHFSDGTVL